MDWIAYCVHCCSFPCLWGVVGSPCQTFDEEGHEGKCVVTAQLSSSERGADSRKGQLLALWQSSGCRGGVCITECKRCSQQEHSGQSGYCGDIQPCHYPHLWTCHLSTSALLTPSDFHYPVVSGHNATWGSSYPTYASTEKLGGAWVPAIPHMLPLKSQGVPGFQASHICFH